MAHIVLLAVVCLLDDELCVVHDEPDENQQASVQLQIEHEARAEEEVRQRQPEKKRQSR